MNVIRVLALVLSIGAFVALWPSQAQAQEASNSPPDGIWCELARRVGVCAGPFLYGDAAWGQRFITAALAIINLRNDPLSVDPMNAKLVDTQGGTHSPHEATYSLEQPLTAGEVPARDQTAGYVMFLVSDSVWPAKVIYSLGALGEDVVLDLAKAPFLGSEAIAEAAQASAAASPAAPQTDAEAPAPAPQATPVAQAPPVAQDRQSSYAQSPPKGTWCESADGVSVCIGNVGYESSLYPFTALRGQRFVVVPMVVWNKRNKPLHVSPTHVTLEDSEGYTYRVDFAIYSLPEPFHSVEVRPGDKAGGVLAFLTNASRGPAKVIYKTALYGGRDIVLDLSKEPRGQ